MAGLGSVHKFYRPKKPFHFHTKQGHKGDTQQRLRRTHDVADAVDLVLSGASIADLVEELLGESVPGQMHGQKWRICPACDKKVDQHSDSVEYPHEFGQEYKKQVWQQFPGLKQLVHKGRCWRKFTDALHKGQKYWWHKWGQQGQ